jgi:hypothetical protein
VKRFWNGFPSDDLLWRKNGAREKEETPERRYLNKSGTLATGSGCIYSLGRERRNPPETARMERIPWKQAKGAGRAEDRGHRIIHLTVWGPLRRGVGRKPGMKLSEGKQ